MQAVSVSGLSFHYKNSKQILFDFDLQIPQGERFGLFGPNGAGKTTLISLMTGVLKPDAGSVELLGVEVHRDHEARKFFGYIPQDFAFYDELTPAENLEYFGAFGLNRAEVKRRSDELLVVLGLKDVRHRVVKSFSGG